MLDVATAPLRTERLELRRTRIEDAAAMFEALRDPEMYRFLPGRAPRTVADVEARFARIVQETAPDRAEQWLNWTVWRRNDDAPLGMIEATVGRAGIITIGYMFDPRTWRRGYGREAAAAMLEHLAACGAREFEATIDIRNAASHALATSLGFVLAETIGLDEVWRLHR
jgi:RimJ/RimL family protein N-acetyltransferase